MSGFSADWLALREPADHAARAGALADALADHLRSRETLRVLDLGAGTGSNLRYLAPRLPGAQEWLLVDHDASLLARADAARPSRADDGRCRVETRVADLRDEVGDAGIYRKRDLVTASALLDLVSAAWIARLAAACRTSGAAVLMALSYDGRMTFAPAEPDDAAVCDLVNRHQRTDKGFGPAAGPDAARLATAALAEAGYDVRHASSDWRLTPADAALQRPLVDGWAEAAAAMAPARAAAIAAWRARRLEHIDAGISRIAVGHVDLLALPPRHAARG